MSMSSHTSQTLAGRVADQLAAFSSWLDGYGETSWDHQSYFAGPIGGAAKELYYKHKILGTLAVAPMIFSEAFVPAARRLFHHPIRFPIADAHYAMGYAYFHGATGEARHLDRAVHFLRELERSRCGAFKEHCWGYPFDWMTRTGVMRAQTPLITTTPYVFEAFLQVHQIQPRDEWLKILESITRHVLTDIKDFPTSEKGSTCSYSPDDHGGVVNASAYRSFMLTSAARFFENPEYQRIADRNLYFVLEAQNADGSWFYAKDGVRDFVDHFHTCFVMKSLAKAHAITGNVDCLAALRRGTEYYLANLFDVDGLPKPFSRAPRMTVYKRELYDCAESVNLCLLLRGEIPAMGRKLEEVVRGILDRWIQPSGAFRARQLHLGWDNVPMHRWGQSQMFRSLAFYLWYEKRLERERGGRVDARFAEQPGS